MQITSYASEKYKDIAETLKDRWIVSPEYQDLKRLFATEEQALGKLLLKRERQTKQLQACQQQQAIVSQNVTHIKELIDRLQNNPTVPEKSQRLSQLHIRLQELRSQQYRLKSQQKRLMKQLEVLKKNIQEKNQSLSEMDRKLDLTLREKSRLKNLIEEAFQRPNTRKKL